MKTLFFAYKDERTAYEDGEKQLLLFTSTISGSGLIKKTLLRLHMRYLYIEYVLSRRLLGLRH